VVPTALSYGKGQDETVSMSEAFDIRSDSFDAPVSLAAIHSVLIPSFFKDFQFVYSGSDRACEQSSIGASF
jgi:hypothetical protein